MSAAEPVHGDVGYLTLWGAPAPPPGPATGPRDDSRTRGAHEAPRLFHHAPQLRGQLGMGTDPHEGPEVPDA